MLPKHPDTQHAKPDSGRNPDTQETLLEAELEKAGLHLCPQSRACIRFALSLSCASVSADGGSMHQHVSG